MILSLDKLKQGKPDIIWIKLISNSSTKSIWCIHQFTTNYTNSSLTHFLQQWTVLSYYFFLPKSSFVIASRFPTMTGWSGQRRIATVEQPNHLLSLTCLKTCLHVFFESLQISSPFQSSDSDELITVPSLILLGAIEIFQTIYIFPKTSSYSSIRGITIL